MKNPTSRRSRKARAARKEPLPYFNEFSPNPADQVPNSVLDAVSLNVLPEPAPPLPTAGLPELEAAELEANTLQDSVADDSAADDSVAQDSEKAPAKAPAQARAMSASERTLSGVRWTTIAMLINQTMTLGRSVALAHLLTREDFGLMGMAASAQSAFSLFTNFGLQNTIISGKFADEEELHNQLNTVFTAEMIRSVVLTLMLMLASWPTARFYDDPRLMPILMVLCLSPFINSFKNIGLTLLSRDVKFRSNTIYNIISSSLMIVAPVILAVWRRDVWALVWGQLASTMIAVAVSYLYHPFRPRLQLDPVALRRSLNFGKWFLVISAMVYITTTADNIFVGKLLGAAVLGSYVLAYSIANLPAMLVAKVLSGVLFPIFAKLGRDETERLRSAVGRVLLVGSSMLVVVTVPMILLAPEMVAVFYGPKWADSAAPLRVLMLVGLFRGMIQLVAPLMMGLDRPDLEARSKIIEAIVFVAVLYPMIQLLGTMGAAWAGVLIYFLSFAMRYRYASQLVPGGFTSMPRLIVTALLASAGGAAAGGLVLHFLADALPLVRLIVAGGVTTVVCAMGLLLLRPELIGELDKFGLTKVFKRLPKRA